MKYINLLCSVPELHCLFPDAKLLSVTFVERNKKYLKIEVNGGIIEINHYLENPFDKLSDLQNIEDILKIDSYYTNPPENTTIICDITNFCLFSSAPTIKSLLLILSNFDKNSCKGLPIFN